MISSTLTITVADWDPTASQSRKHLTSPTAHATAGTGLHGHMPPCTGRTDAEVRAEVLPVCPGSASNPRRRTRRTRTSQ